MSIKWREHIQAASQAKECHILNLLNLEQKKISKVQKYICGSVWLGNLMEKHDFLVPQAPYK